ncbi:bactofilin family protein [Candidatus Palauibacter sp.]|uniref:bactofilin family protein n=1 Tax=Candidatus Palauibacter sp. TaxID=3101350 RepID=UPI003B528B93
MARDSRHGGQTRELSDVVSVVAPGMTILGDVMCDGTVRVEGKIEGSIKATKSVVVGKDGRITGDIETQDVVVAGTVVGTVVGASRVELQETCRIEGDIRSRCVKLDEGGQIEGRLHMTAKATGEKTAAAPQKGASPSLQPPKPQRAAGRS